MAISSSGAVSFANIQTEYGGSNPISLNEYYSGSLPSNTTSQTITPTVVSTSTNYTSGKSTFTRNADGWSHDTVNDYTSGSSSSQTITKRSGVDLTGNSGAIPSSGIIDMNKFRGTSAGSASSETCYGVVIYRDTGSIIPNLGFVYVSGHLGTASTSFPDTTAWGTSFTSITCAAEGNNSATTIWCNSSTNTSNNFFQGRYSIAHQNNGTVGNYTVFAFLGSASTTMGSFSGTWSLQFNF